MIEHRQLVAGEGLTVVVASSVGVRRLTATVVGGVPGEIELRLAQHLDEPPTSISIVSGALSAPMPVVSSAGRVVRCECGPETSVDDGRRGRRVRADLPATWFGSGLVASVTVRDLSASGALVEFPGTVDTAPRAGCSGRLRTPTGD